MYCILPYSKLNFKTQKFLPNLWKQTCVLLSECAVKHYPQHVLGFLTWPAPYNPCKGLGFVSQRPTVCGGPCCSQWLWHRWAPSSDSLRKSCRAVQGGCLPLVGYSWPIQAFFLHSLFLAAVHPFFQTVLNSRPWEGLFLWCVQCNWEWEDFFS